MFNVVFVIGRKEDQCTIQDDVFDLSEYNSNIGMKALNNEVINFLNRAYARKRNMDNGQPIK